MAKTYAVLQQLSASSAANLIEKELQMERPSYLAQESDYPIINENAKYVIKVFVDLEQLQTKLEQYQQQLSQQQQKEQSSDLSENNDSKDKQETLDAQLDYAKDALVESEGQTSTQENKVDYIESEQYDYALNPNIVKALDVNQKSQDAIDRLDIATSIKDESGQYKNIKGIWIYVNNENKGYISLSQSQLNPNIYNGYVYAKASNSTEEGGENGIRIFFMLYRFVEIKFRLVFTDNTRLDVYFSSYLYCNSTTQDNKNVQDIVEKLTSLKNSDILDMMFRNFAKSSQEKVNSNDTKAFIQLLNNIVHCYKENLHYFQKLAKHSLIKGNTVTTINQVKSVRPKNIRWLFHNLNQLNQIPESKDSFIQYEGNSYIPLHMQTTQNVKSYDIYENRVIVGFLHTVLLHSKKIVTEFKLMMQALEEDNDSNDPKDPTKNLSSNVYTDTTNEELILDHETNLILNKIRFSQNQSEFRELQDLVKEISTLYTQYEKIFNLKNILIETIPRKVQAFHELKPYAHIFTEIIKWFRFGKFNLEKTRYELNVKTLDLLFEHYCVYALLSMLIENKFKPIDQPSYLFKYSTDDNSKTNQIANTYMLIRKHNKHKQLVTLYYQPHVFSKHFANNLLTFRTTQTNKNQEDLWTPDFILKFTDYLDQPELTTEEYVILDAKFANKDLILSKYIEPLILKYCNGINILQIEPVLPPEIATKKEIAFSRLLRADKLFTERYINLRNSQITQAQCNNVLTEYYVIARDSLNATKDYLNAFINASESEQQAMLEAQLLNEQEQLAQETVLNSQEQEQPSEPISDEAQAELSLQEIVTQLEQEQESAQEQEVKEEAPEENQDAKEEVKEADSNVDQNEQLSVASDQANELSLTQQIAQTTESENNQSKTIEYEFPIYRCIRTKSPCMMIALQGRINKSKADSVIHDVYDSPLFKYCVPTTKVGVVEIRPKNTDATDKLWDQIKQSIPFLK